MKKIKIISTMLSVVLLFSVSSCKKYIDEDINVNPNQPSDVPLSLLLPSLEGGLAYTTGSDMSRIPGLWIQQVAGLANQHLVFDNYGVSESDINNMWYFNIYSTALSNANIIISKANENGSPYYAGIGKILMAYGLGMTSDMWGDVPYSQAFKGGDDLTPGYDSQQSIYTSIQSLLTQAKNDLGAAKSTFIPGSDDLIYGGDNAKWIALANSLSARYWIHLSKVPGSNAYQNALDAIAAGAITTNGDDPNFPFSDFVTEGNPWFQFNDQRAGDIGMGKFFVDLLLSLNDPRLPAYATTDASDTAYSGSAAGAGDGGVSAMGAYASSSSSSIQIISYTELKFIEAEAKFQTGDLAGAAAAHNDGVISSLDKVGVTDTAYITANGTETSATISLNKIMTQKYIALFSQCEESFTDWRRTGIPSLSLATNALTNQIPRRFPYPQSERLHNGSNVPPASLITRVWWDQ
ncbi:MAG: SusD/RagB family nutrient-binding outer membrane lipoprotein [Bacteroidota bacterium]